MSRWSSEEWERRKWYLVRSLFEDLPVLSPIPEGHERSGRGPSTESTTSSRCSPLPDLILEKEPNRHDEPEEYYQELEQIVLPIYKKLFLDTGDTSTNGEQFSDDEVIEEETTTTTSASSPIYQVIVAQAEVHRAGTEDDTDFGIGCCTDSASSSTTSENLMSELQGHSASTAVTSTLTSVSNSREVVMEFEEDQSAASVTLEEPEVMRREASNKSVESILATNTGRHFSGDVIYESSPKVAPGMEEEESSSHDFSIILGITSTPKRTVGTPVQNSDREDRYSRRRNLLVTSSDVADQSASRSPTKNLNSVAIQTSFSASSDECDWDEIKTHLFEGSPCIYNFK